MIENNISDPINFNYTRHFDSYEEQSASGLLIILQTVFTISFFCISCPILLFIIHFEQFSGDPQKRCISNMTFSSICFFTLIQQGTFSILLALRTIFGPLYHIVGDISCRLHLFFLTGYQISTIACLFFKNLQVLKPSTRLSLNDEFWYKFVSIFTIITALIHASSGHSIVTYYVLIGYSSLLHFTFVQLSIRR